MTTTPATRRAIDCRRFAENAPEELISREWLVTNGLGGYSNGTLAGVPTRCYHGLLVAALPAPLGRVLLMGPLWEQIRLPGGTTFHLGCTEYQGGRLELPGGPHLVEFALEDG